jgi:hypothetical protein
MPQPTAPDPHDHNPPRQRTRRVTRRTMDSKVAARPSSKAVTDTPVVEVTWRFVEDPARLQALARLLFDQAIDQEPTASGGPDATDRSID